MNLGLRSGIDDLVDHRAQSRPPLLVEVDEATWRKYAYDDWLELWELVLLHSRVDLGLLGLKQFRVWVQEDDLVKVVDFHARASEVRLPVVEAPWAERCAMDAELPRIVYRFPYRTQWLEVLKQLAWQMAKLSKRETPTRARVREVARAICSDLSDNLADAFATILRKDDAPMGRPRRSHD